MRHRFTLAALGLAGLAWAGCRDAADPGSIDPGVSSAADSTNLPPHAGFSFSCSGLTCNFLDTSNDSDGVIVRYDWEFGDGGRDTVPNPTHTYAAPGSYDVFHAVVDDDGAVDSLHRTVTVTGDSGGGNQPPIAFFDFNCTGLTCQFTDLSVDSGGTIVQWTWFFGDGGTDSLQHPSHAYAAAGTYQVDLVIYDDGGATDTASRLVSVSDSGGGNTPPVAIFDFNCSGLSCQFTDLSVDSGGTIVQWTWLFGDGGIDTTQNPFHTYAAPGSYTVQLFVRDNEGASDSTARVVSVSDTTGGAVLTLVAEGFRVKGVHHVSLLWSGATSDSFVVFRDSAQIAAVVGDTTYVDNIGAKGHATYVYQVCQVGGVIVCSNAATVQFSRPTSTRR